MPFLQDRRAITSLTNRELAAVYNMVSPIKITKFSDRLAALRRVANVMEKYGKKFVSGPEGSVAVTDVEKAMNSNDFNVITVLHDKNPKRGKSAERFALYQTGMTIGQYVDAVIAIGDRRRKAIRDITHDLEHEYISIAIPPEGPVAYVETPEG